MAGQQLPDDLFAWLRDLERRLVALERSPQLTQAAIKDGTLTVFDAAGVARVKIGKDGTDYGVKVYDAAGANAVSLATLAFGIQALTDVGLCSTTSTVFADPNNGGAAGPAVAVTVGPSGRMLVFLSCEMTLDAYSSVFTGDVGQMAYDISGATTRPADVNRVLINYLDLSPITAKATTPATLDVSGTRVFLESGLTPGAHTVTAKYRSVTGTNVNFTARTLVVIPY